MMIMMKMKISEQYNSVSLDAMRRLCSKPPKKIDMVRNNNGNLSTKEEEV